MASRHPEAAGRKLRRFVTGATVANFTCLAAARGEVLRRAGWDADARGLFGAPEITVLIGDDAHTTVFSALQFLGLGHDRVLRLPTDAMGRIDPASLTGALASFGGPCIAILQAGQINTGGFDDFTRLIPTLKEKGAWVHIDGASASGRRHRRNSAISAAASRRPTAGRPTATSGCRRPMTAAMRSCATSLPTAAP